MRSRFRSLAVAPLVALLVAALAHAGGVPARGATTTASRGPATPAVFSKVVFAGGCFWCMETAFEGLRGVRSVISGYCGGTRQNPTYEESSTGLTGHAESIEVTYDPRVVTYPQLLDVFWHNIDPTDAGGQFCDRGNQYRAAIFFRDASQQREAEASKRALMSAPQRFKGPIVTEIVPATTFWPAEEYHQDFYRKDPVRYQSYRLGCGRDRRLTQLWGKPGRHGEAK